MKQALRWFIFCLAVVLVGTSHPAFAEARQKSASSGRPATSTPAYRDFGLYRLALDLARYGDVRQDPLALIQAAKILSELEGGSSKIVRKSEASSAQDTEPSARYGSEAMLARARKLSAGRADLLGLADDVAQNKGRGCMGCGRNVVDFRIGKGETITYVHSIEGYKPVVVAILGLNDDKDHLDLYVTDEVGKQVCEHAGPGGEKTCRWTPRWDGKFDIRVVNRGEATDVKLIVNQ